MNKKTEKYLEESAKLFKALRLSTSELEKLIEEGPKGEDQNDNLHGNE